MKASKTSLVKRNRTGQSANAGLQKHRWYSGKVKASLCRNGLPLHLHYCI